MTGKKLLFSILLLAILALPLGDPTCASTSSLKASDGRLDLTPWQPEEEVIELSGQWEFYWNQLLEPGEPGPTGNREYINVPGSWNGHTIDGANLDGDGFATYRLTFYTEETERLGIKVPRIFTSYKLWVNEELIASAGVVGKSGAESVPQYFPQVAFFEPREDGNEIIVQVSNFSHRSGGILESFTLGREAQVLDLRLKNIAYELFLFGGLLIIGAYHLALFAFRRKDYSALYFGLFCIFVSTRTLLVGERFFISMFPDFSWEAAHNIQTLTFYLGVPLIVMFFKTIFPDDISRGALRAVQLVGLAFGALVLFTPAKIFTLFNSAFQAFVLTVIFYLSYILIKNLPKKEPSVTFIVTGALALIITTLNDLIFFSVWMNDQGPAFLRNIIVTGNLSSFGQLIFVFTYSLALAQKFSHAFIKEEEMTEQLKEMNTSLDSLVRKRTDALEQSSKEIEYQKNELEKANRALQLQSLKDPLTDLWNRRHFDETLQLEWRRALRHSRPISLLMLDLDYFKAYNDNYGHQAGDECLQLVAKELMYSFNRASDLAARYGGEEFIVIMPETGSREAFEKALSVKNSIENLKIAHEFSPVCSYVTVSIGVSSTVPKSESSPKDLILEADKSLYQAKAGGRNCVECSGSINRLPK